MKGDIPTGWDVFDGGGDDQPPPPSDEDNPDPSIDIDRRCTDIANSRIFVASHGDDLRYCYERDAWVSWTGTRWSWAEATREVERRAASTATDELDRVLEAVDPPKALRTWVRRSCSVASRRSMVEGARHQLSVAISDLDSDPMVLNTKGGTISLSKGIMATHQRGDMITHQASTEANLDARCSRWESFISEIFGGSEDLIGYVQRAIGYSVTGRMDEQKMFVCLGAGANGKSVMLGTLKTVLGSYASTISASLLTAGGMRNKFPEIATLLGVRFAVAAEPDARSQLDESLVKSVTGGDEMVGERKYEAPFTFRPVCKLWLACNQIPSFQSGGFSMERRVVVIPFRKTFSGENCDPSLPVKLASEAPGILAWIVRGTHAWLEKGLEEPQEIIQATQEARGDTDPLHWWWVERVAAQEDTRISVSDLYSDYKEWCDTGGQKPMAMPRFRSLIRGRGIEIVTIGRRLHLVGVGLAADGKPGTLHIEENESIL